MKQQNEVPGSPSPGDVSQQPSVGRLRDTQRAGVRGTAAGPEVSESPRILSVQESAEDGLATGATGKVLAVPSAEAGGGREAGCRDVPVLSRPGSIQSFTG